MNPSRLISLALLTSALAVGAGAAHAQDTTTGTIRIDARLCPAPRVSFSSCQPLADYGEITLTDGGGAVLTRDDAVQEDGSDVWQVERGTIVFDTDDLAAVDGYTFVGLYGAEVESGQWQVPLTGDYVDASLSVVYADEVGDAPLPMDDDAPSDDGGSPLGLIVALVLGAGGLLGIVATRSRWTRA